MLDGSGRDSRNLANCKVCSIGPGTTARLRSRGIRPDLVPEQFTSQAVFDALTEANEVKGNRFLLPRADIAGKALPRQLRDAGAEVTDIEAYRTLRPTPDPETIEALRAGEVDIVTFTSSSTARNFAAIMRDELGEPPGDVAYVSIGPVTSQTIREESMQLAVEAPESTIDGLVAAILKYRK